MLRPWRRGSSARPGAKRLRCNDLGQDWFRPLKLGAEIRDSVLELRAGGLGAVRARRRGRQLGAHLIELGPLGITCFPARSWWKPEVALKARVANGTHQRGSVVQTAESMTYAGVVARLPLHSTEVDRERERESSRRNTVAQTVVCEEVASPRRKARRARAFAFSKTFRKMPFSSIVTRTSFANQTGKGGR